MLFTAPWAPERLGLGRGIGTIASCALVVLPACSQARLGGEASAGSRGGDEASAESGEGGGTRGSATGTSAGSSSAGEGGTSGPGEVPGSSGDEVTSGSGGVRLDVGPGGEGESGGSGEGGSLPGCAGAAEQTSNQGCEFWAVDLPQAWWIEGGGPHSPQDGTFAVAVANGSGRAASVSVFRGTEATAVDGASVAVGQLHVFSLPALNVNPQRSTMDGVAWRIESDVPVTAYQFNTLEQSSSRFSADASLLFPVHVLRGDYTTFTGDGLFSGISPLGYGDVGAFVSIVGLVDGTLVDVYPTHAVESSVPTTGVAIDRGQVFTLIGGTSGQFIPIAGEGNLTGSRIVASHPVAVFSGNVGSREPVNDTKCCADHLEEQMLPLVAWGDRYVAAPPVSPNTPGNTRASYRLVGGEDGIVLTYHPVAPSGAPLGLDAYQIAYFVTDQAFSVTGSRPFGVAQFYLGSHETGDMMTAPDGEADGDPSMVVLPTVDQFQESYVFLVPPTYTNNYVTAIAPVGTAITLDGAPVAAAAAPAGEVQGLDYEFRQIPMVEGAHVLTGTAPFQITVYGYTDYSSYGYPGGSGLRTISEPPPPPVG